MVNEIENGELEVKSYPKRKTNTKQKSVEQTKTVVEYPICNQRCSVAFEKE